MSGQEMRDTTPLLVPPNWSKPRSQSHTYQRLHLTERSALLAAVTSGPFVRPSEDDEGFADDELADTEINPNDFDVMLSRSTTYSAAMGFEPQSLETPMLRGPRRYSAVIQRKPSVGTVRRRSVVSLGGLDNNSTIDEEGGDVEFVTVEGKSPFLGGISVGRFWMIFSVILGVHFISYFDSTIMASSHPVITSYFNMANSASWLSTAFLVTSTAFQPVFGRLSDTIGRKDPYLLSIFIFMLATIWCATATSMTSFIIGRAICGLGAGGSLTLGAIICSDLVPIEIRGAYSAYLNLMYSIGCAIGAATGGWIADALGWRWEFSLQVPILLFALIAAWIAIPADIGKENGPDYNSFWDAIKSFDYPGSIVLTISLVALILGINLGGNVLNWLHPIVIAALLIFVLGTIVFIWIESRAEKPIMPLYILIQAPRANLIFSNFIGTIVVSTILFNVPIFFQAVLLNTATASGLRLVVISAAGSISSAATGFLITWSKKMKWSLLWGSALLLLGTICFSIQHRTMPDILLMSFLLPAALGRGFQFPGSFLAILAVSDQSEQAVVTSTLFLWRSLGQVLGVAGSSLVLQNALVYFLHQYVDGPLKDQIITEVRRSIQAIAHLPPEYREQVIDAYGASLRATFCAAAALAAISLLIVIPVKLPRLGKRIETNETGGAQ